MRVFIPHKVLEEKLKQILAEDIGQGDVTTAAVVPSGLTAEAAVIAKEAGIAAGIEETVILAESLGRMSGIATTTRKLTEKLKKAKATAKIAATRKTAPGLLYFDKKAVLIGGGDPHRLHLDDMILVKDNHIAVAGSIENAVKMARHNASFSKKIEIEVSRVTDALKAAEAGADIIMFDNVSPKQAKESIELLIKAAIFGRI